MKKQIFFTAVIVSGMLFSCTKEKIETQSQLDPMQSSNSAQPVKESNQIYINTLNIGLAGRFEFNGNLKEQAGKLPDGTSTGRGAAYTTDRYGNSASALYLTGNYGVNLSDVPQQTNASLTVWAKSLKSQYVYIAAPDFAQGILFKQSRDTYLGGETIPSVGGMVTSIGLGGANNQWHHIAITFDGSNIRVYADGVLHATTAFMGSFAQYLAKYHIGFSNGQSGYWNGCLDDLRFYSRTLSPSEVQQLASL